jgi:hypothetical protein
VLRIFIAFKNPSPWPGSSPQALGPLASTLTTTSPRQHIKGRAQTDSVGKQGSQFHILGCHAQFLLHYVLQKKLINFRIFFKFVVFANFYLPSECNYKTFNIT